MGAGLAGLTAAYRLTLAGASVRVFEARHRIGGRVYTIRDLLGGQHGEAGADLIEEGQDAVLELARELGLKTERVLEKGFEFLVQAGGRRRHRSSQAPLWDAIEALFTAELACLRAVRGHDASPALRRLASIPLAHALRERGAAGAVLAMADALRGFFLADAEDLSLLPVLEQAALGTPGRLYRIKGGNDRLVNGLAATLAQPIDCGQAAVSVTVAPGSRPRVGLLAGDGSLTQVTADYVVLAIPAATLVDVAFDPPLPERQTAAIQRLRYGLATKALLQFDRPFWRKPGHARAMATNTRFGAVWDAGERQRGRQGLLTLLGGGGASAALAGWLESGGPSGGRDLGWLGRPATLLASHVVRWELERWSRGGYAYLGAGDDPGLRPWLARPYGPVVFAGEHTSVEAQGYMSGAVESGHRAALEVEALASGLDALGG
jgi:monoamine oxidase